MAMVAAPGQVAPAVALPGMPRAAAAGSGLSVKLSDSLIQNLAVGKVYRDHKLPLTGLDFTHDGMNLVTCGEDNSVFVYSCDRAQRTRHLKCENFGVSFIRFLHNDRDAAVAASRNQGESVLKYWDFHENKYLRVFRSHTGPITSVCPHPYEDMFLSGSQDRTVMLWDLRQDRPTAKINGQGPSIASFDQQGMVFATCVGKPKVHLFDTRNYARGEFVCFDLAPSLGANAVAHFVQFSPCGKYLLVRTDAKLVLVDAFDGEVVCEYPVSAEAPGRLPPAPGFSPDSQYVISGMAGGETCIWQTTNAREVHRLRGHSTAPNRVAFSPMHALAVTAAETLAWWIPDASA